ncbi:MAG: M20/M25/M40 family metallo-hydrolase, partial [Pirellulales bacterium]|nr:M20/M25/M40 family metallo-hydrolase [Pirellulales bacterium]
MKRQAKRTTTAKPKAPKSPKPSAPAGPEPDLKQAEQLLMKLLSIPGVSQQEGKVAEFITKELRSAGVSADAIQTDDANKRTPGGGEVGNLVCHLPGTVQGPRRLFMAHMDTVPLALGVKPVVRGKEIVPQQKDKALGGDNRSGVAVVLGTALEVLRQKLPHPPLTFLWTVQEELGLKGMTHARASLLRKPKLAFNFDGSSPEKITIGATSGYRMTIEIQGVASHAGVRPEGGVNAITIASLAIAQLHNDGWLGLVVKGNRTGTSNIGV